mgnify:FL=1
MQNKHIDQAISIAILGGGVAGSTIALRLAELGIACTLIEKSNSLVNGPPICHLHAGGNLYREISDQQCLTLLKQSIETLKVYPQSVNKRPTVIALPNDDKAQPEDLLPRLQLLQQHYSQLIKEDASNEILGPAEDYFEFFTKEQVQALAQCTALKYPQTAEEWMIPVAKNLDINKLQFPLLMVQEYGLSGFRFAAIVSLALEKLSACTVLTNTKVTDIKQQPNESWELTLTDSLSGENQQQHFDYLINACGFRSGEIDDMLKQPRQRMVEFKAAYVAHWPQAASQNTAWPEVIFYGERGTPNGMAQLTPYPDGYFQLHGMTQDITLFNDGLVSSNASSAQPQLDARFIKKIDSHWPADSANQRTLGSISHMAKYLPNFAQASSAAKPLFGAQQIPGDDPALRAADVSFAGHSYARTEIVKASSALTAADHILQHLYDNKLLAIDFDAQSIEQHAMPITQSITEEAVDKLALDIAKQRHYPTALAKNFSHYTL